MIRVGAVGVVLLLSAVARAQDASPAAQPDPAFAALAIPSEGDPFSIDVKNRLSVAVKHVFARTEAVSRLGYLLAYWKKRFGIESQWRGDRVFVSGNVYGIKIEALFAIDDSSIVGFARDPGWPWAGRVQSYVDRKLKKYLDPDYDDP